MATKSVTILCVPFEYCCQLKNQTMHLVWKCCTCSITAAKATNQEVNTTAAVMGILLKCKAPEVY